jgi:pyruvate/2-oxoglutarate dehydrogenase complex dihydrolipoamide acyltransferase (E2) component
MTQGRLVKWLKATGDRVERYDILFEVETEELVEEVFKASTLRACATECVRL